MEGRNEANLGAVGHGVGSFVVGNLWAGIGPLPSLDLEGAAESYFRSIGQGEFDSSEWLMGMNTGRWTWHGIPRSNSHCNYFVLSGGLPHQQHFEPAL